MVTSSTIVHDEQINKPAEYSNSKTNLSLNEIHSSSLDLTGRNMKDKEVRYASESVNMDTVGHPVWMCAYVHHFWVNSLNPY